MKQPKILAAMMALGVMVAAGASYAASPVPTCDVKIHCHFANLLSPLAGAAMTGYADGNPSNGLTLKYQEANTPLATVATDQSTSCVANDATIQIAFPIDSAGISGPYVLVVSVTKQGGFVGGVATGPGGVNGENDGQSISCIP